MKFKRIIYTLLLLVYFIPINVLGYSNYLIPGGDNIGIKVNNKYVTVQGFYKVNDKYLASDIGLQIGDFIIKVNDTSISSIDELINIINKSNNDIKLTVLRDNKELTYELPLIKDNDIIKTGIYVKSSVSGIGTLTYIDPSTNIFGALGHEIIDKDTLLKIDIKDGLIFKSDVVSITRSENGNPGEKNARYYTNETYGKINKNEKEGIFGIYNDTYDKNELIEINDIDNVKLGKAYIRTVIDNNIKEDFEIIILNIDKTNTTKNILFEVTDNKLLNITNGIVAGMSGSPIIQDDKLIGAVTHVVVDDTHKGFGISIKNMLIKGEE